MLQKPFTAHSNADSLPLSALITLPENEPPKCVLQIVHGMSEYKERYLPLCEHMAQQGIVCLLHDHRGHGKSPYPEKPLGYFGENGAKALADDIEAVWEQAGLSNVPRVLLGHSMGSLLVRECVKTCDRNIAALIVCGSPSANPLVGFGKALCAFFTLFKGEAGHSRLLDFMAIGSFNLAIRHPRTIFDWLNMDEKEVDRYIADPLCGFPFTLNGYKALFDAMQMAYAPCTAQNPDLPVLFLAGGDDPCAGGIQKLDAAACAMRDRGYRNVDTLIYKGQRHEILLSPIKEKVFSDLSSWIMASL